MTVHTTFLGMDITALVFKTHTGRWEIDDMRVMNEGHDMFNALNDDTLLEIEERVLIAAQNQDYKWL